ncbi:MAG: response regulator [Limisphaerales bacterium]
MTSSPAIFLVEDEALIAMELRDRLTALGYTVCGQAARGELALEKIPALAPDIVLMDIRLAGALNGVETALRLRERCDVAVVFLTAFSDTELIQQVGAAGSFGYLVKPFEERELHATLQVALCRHAADRQLREANRQLQTALANVKQLEGLIPICMFCKKIRDPKDYWHQIEAYLSAHTSAKFSHSMCPECCEKYMRQLDAEAGGGPPPSAST